MKKCLVTGSNGLLGSYLVSLLSKSYEVYTVTRKGSPHKIKNVLPVYLNLGDTWSTSMLPEYVDVVYLLAQSNHHKDAYDNSNDIFNVNIASVFRIIDHFSKRKVKKIIVASSGGIYKAAGKPLTENSATKEDPDLYIMSKLCTEIMIQVYRKYCCIDILRPFFIYGPGQKFNFLIPKLIDFVRSGKPIILQGKTGLKLNPIFVKDAAQAFYNCASLKGSRDFNIAGNEILSIKDIAITIGKVLKLRPVFDTQHTTGLKHLVADINAMKNVLHKPVFSFREGIIEYLKNEKI